MTAQAQLRAMLDELMGTARDGESKSDVKFTDTNVCRSFLMGCCPFDILSGTRLNLGDCSKVHDLALKADYEMASKSKDLFYDLDALEQLQTFITDADKQTEVAKQKLAETQEQLSEEATGMLDKVHEFAESIGKTLAKAEQLGANGNVAESLKLMEEVASLKKAKYEKELEYRNTIPASTYQQQKLRVCEVCCAYLGIYDNDRRLADHFGGKLHLGFITIREKLTEMKKLVEENQVVRQEQREQRWADREKEREKEREEREERERKRTPSPQPAKSRSRSPSAEHRRHKTRSRSRSRRTRSRSRDRRRRSRSRSHERRRRSRSPERRRRSRSRSRHRRSRSPRRRRSRSRGRRRDVQMRSRSNPA
ncbi:PREDICTED: putative RNA-binding protein Luc7-like 2 [Priapulus caudatus]|uniref:RNA-binding protein Luc7-like 2 n=1 Tax=Priapulus caudatus TaxID=37621 RepID=A0ABM1E8V8_PRICU|nr:PREDICTED: putative RNA-binding protein Luc7-like 2 [Priapulus caudatus]